MADRSTITQIVQLGQESVPGTKVRANRKLQTIDFATNPQFKVDQFRPAGFKFDTVTATQKEWIEVGLKAQPTYTEMLYLLSSVITTPAAPTTILDGVSADTSGRKWIFEPSTSSPDTPMTFTIEQGSSFRAHQFGYGIVSELGLNFTRDKTEASGKMLAQGINDNFPLSAARVVSDGATTSSNPTVTSATAAFTAVDVGSPISGAGIPASSYIGVVNSPTSIGLSSSATTNTPVNATATASGVTLTIAANPTTVPLVPITASQFTVYFDSTSGALGTTKLGRLFSGNFMLGGRYGPIWVVDQSLASFAAHVETVPNLGMKLVLEADAAGMALLPLLRANTTYFIRALAKGPVIYNSAAPYIVNPLTYSFQLDMAVQVKNAGNFQDQQGVYAIEFDLVGVHDQTWGKAVHIEVVNKMTAL